MSTSGGMSTARNRGEAASNLQPSACKASHQTVEEFLRGNGALQSIPCSGETLDVLKGAVAASRKWLRMIQLQPLWSWSACCLRAAYATDPTALAKFSRFNIGRDITA